MSLEAPVELLSLQEIAEDKLFTFEPSTFDDYLGQSVIKEKLNVYVKAAKMRNEHLDHLLIFGPPGLGKTTLARVIAKELDVDFRVTSAPVIERTGDLVAIISSLEPKAVLFIDEIHRLPKNVEEILYSAMENFCVDVIIGQGAGAKSIRLPINPFTLIGATTKTGALSGPLQTRFGIVERIDFYEPAELAAIVDKNATFLGMPIEAAAALTIGQRGRGTPRVVKRILRRVRDFAQVHNYKIIDTAVVNQALQFLDIDEDGLTKLDRKVLIHIIKDFEGGPVGIETLAAITGEDKDTLEDFCEPYLIRLGLLQKTSRGRQIASRKIISLKRKLFGETFEEQKSLTE
ncbi:Holliday junction branch migration DNA helicase RuvB [Candidatus Babeliales bacterium]|nr:Holliday junction branch migration DNA helicase RuvB [Candidatus Babeliales bacterium]